MHCISFIIIEDKCTAFQKVVSKYNRVAVGETRERVGNLMAAMVEKFTELTDVVDRGLRDLSDQMDGERFATPSGSGSRPRRPSYDTPRRPDKVQKRSRCPFCGKPDCADPTQCALRIRWGSRLSIHKRRGLCPDRTCYKPHKGRCIKAGEIKCSHCGQKHLSIWCIYKAQDDGML